MATETELKLRIEPGQLARLKRHALLREHQLTRPVTRRLYSIYYDTPRFKLQREGMALRLRRVGRQWLQTLKGGGSVLGGLHQRNEWESPVQGPVPDLGLLQHIEYVPQLGSTLSEKLQPVFVTDFSRNSRMLMWQGAHIELSMDQGEISTVHQRVPLCELELELKSGEPQQLFELALALLDIVPFELEPASKAEQGYRLFSGYVAQPVRAAAVQLSKRQPLGAALQSLLWSVLQQVQGNLQGIGLTRDAEYLHQLRVALRRLRVLLRMAESAGKDAQLAAFRNEFAAQCKALGTVREWDVFIGNILQPMCKRMPQNDGLAALLAAAMQQRAAAYAELGGEDQARAWQRLLLRFGSWMLGKYWREFAGAEVQARNFSGKYLARLADRYAQAAADAEQADAAALHEMRIAAKKLRYVTEFFSSLYGKRRAGQYRIALSAMQEVLGQIHDDTVASRLLDTLASVADSAMQRDAPALVRGWLAHDMSQQLRNLNEAALQFGGRHAYWRKAG